VLRRKEAFDPKVSARRQDIEQVRAATVYRGGMAQYAKPLPAERIETAFDENIQPGTNPRTASCPAR